MNPLELLGEYAFIIIFLMIAFFQWFVTKFRKQDEDVFEWPDDDDDKSQQERQQEDPLAEIRRRLEDRMGGGGAPPPLPAPTPGRRTSPTPEPQPRPTPRAQPQPAVLAKSEQPTRRVAGDYKEREQKEREPRIRHAIITREEIRRRRLEVDARTEALAAALPAPRSAYATGPRPASTGRRARVRRFLSSPDSIRDAVVLQEILGTPRSRKAL